MNRSMLGAYWTIWSQQKPPSAVLSKIVVGSNDLNVLPASVEYDTYRLAVAMTTLPLSAPLMSAAVVDLGVPSVP